MNKFTDSDRDMFTCLKTALRFMTCSSCYEGFMILCIWPGDSTPVNTDLFYLSYLTLYLSLCLCLHFSLCLLSVSLCLCLSLSVCLLSLSLFLSVSVSLSVSLISLCPLFALSFSYLVLSLTLILSLPSLYLLSITVKTCTMAFPTSLIKVHLFIFIDLS